MLYYLATLMMDRFGPARVFQYPSFRIPAAALSALTFSLILFPSMIRRLRLLQHGATQVREDVPDRHKIKHGTPTMGGLFILLIVAVVTLMWADLRNGDVWACLGVMLGFGAIGFVDDFRKVTKKSSKGLSGRKKLLWQALTLLAVGFVLHLWHTPSQGLLGTGIDSHLAIPFVPLKMFHPDLGLAYLVLIFLVVAGTSNAVNLTDGLDGLAIGPVIVSAATFLFFAYVAGLVLTITGAGGCRLEFNAADYLGLPHVPEVGELAIMCAAIIGAGLGFLWYNTHPATVFMGDVGSLALGGVLGTLAVLTKNELLSALLHGVFLMEALSVITQVASFKLTGRRIFRMAPIHHHFELKGWAEPKIIVRFWLISIILALLSLTTLKLR